MTALKPLPKVVRPAMKEQALKGTISKQAWERRVFRTSLKKES